MGIVQSIKRSLEDEGGERPIYPCRRLPSVSIYNGVRPRKGADPLLPLQNPESAGSSSEAEHLLDKTIIISSMSDDHTSHVREEEKKKKKKIVAVGVCEEERWIKHYSSRHRILLVGDGDFSFSASLALAFLSASNIIATSLDSYEFLKKNYSDALSNIEELRSRYGTVMHGIDATKMANHALLRHLRFDRIIYNFPYAGLKNIKKLPRQSQLRRHRRLVSRFLKNAREMISENGEIHISHKTNAFHVEFKIEHLASSHRLRLIEAVNFDRLDYPGYHTKYGFGGDNNFNCNPSKTYKFGLKMLP